MTRKFHGRVKLNRGYVADIDIVLMDNGWVYIEEESTYYPPTRVQYVEESEEKGVE